MSAKRCGPLAACLVALLLAGSAGCSSSAKYNDQVEGTVTLDNQPLGGVVVMFIPEGEAGPGIIASRAISDDQGHFKMEREDQKPGALLGKHRIVITRGRPPDRGHGEKAQDPLSKDQRPVPTVYANAQKSPLGAVVSADKHTGYDFNLKSNAP